MSTVNMTLGGRQKIATVTAKNELGGDVDMSKTNVTFVIDTPNIITPGSGVGTASQEMLAHATGQAGVTFSAAYSAAVIPGGGPAVAAPTDEVVVSIPAIASVSVSWADEP